MTTRWPESLWLVRHGQSAGNVARDAADEAGHFRIAIQGRDVDVPLSPLGESQADALGHWFAAAGSDKDRPEVILVSPYTRARQTADRFCAAGGAADGVVQCVDERLREKEFGILDGLTVAGIHAEQPDQAEFRRILGKFYHRPPGGESWCDVIFRLRAVLDMISLHYAERRVMIVAHQVVVLCLRYIVEHLSEEQILAIDHAGDVANCSVTHYQLDRAQGPHGALDLSTYNQTAPVRAEAAVTSAPDRPLAARG